MKTKSSTLPDWALVVLCTLGIAWAARDAYADGSTRPSTIDWTTGTISCTNVACIGPGTTCTVPAGPAGTFTANVVVQWGWRGNPPSWQKELVPPFQNQPARMCRCCLPWTDDQGQQHLIIDYVAMNQNCCEVVLFDPSFAKIGTIGDCKTPGCILQGKDCVITGPITAAEADCTPGS